MLTYNVRNERLHGEATARYRSTVATDRVRYLGSITRHNTRDINTCATRLFNRHASFVFVASSTAPRPNEFGNVEAIIPIAPR